MIQWGVNVGGMGMGRAQDGYMRHGVYGTDYRKNTQAEIDYLAAHGFDYHRLQHMWYRLQHTLGGDLDTTDLGYLDDMIVLIGYSDIPPAQSVVGISSVSNLSSLVL